MHAAVHSALQRRQKKKVRRRIISTAIRGEKWEGNEGETCTCTCPTAARQSLISHERRGFVSERFGRGGDSGGGDSGGGTTRLQKKIM